MTIPSSARLAPKTRAIIDAYCEQVLTCPLSVARSGRVHVLSVPARGLPAWHGYTMPIVAIALSTGAVIACRPDLVEQLEMALGSDVKLPALDSAALRRVHRAVRRILPHAFTLGGDFRAVDGATFMPSKTSERAEHIADNDPAALHLRTRFDGALFGLRGPRGRLISYAALKLKSASVWEIAVATEPDYRGRGYARDVVSAASRFALEHGRVPIYINDRDNSNSAFVARSLGYQRYCDIVLGEY